MTPTILGKRAATHINRAARKFHGIAIRRPHMDGQWGIRVCPKGKITFEGYAASSYPEGTTLAQLTRTDHVGFLNEILRLGAGMPQPTQDSAHV